MNTPAMVRIRQHLDRPVVADIPAAVAAELERLELSKRIKPGQTVALTAGSRGIANIPAILKATADHLKKIGAKPFLIPAMGSHGGGVAEGQVKIIESYGITSDYVGVPIKASMDTVQVGTTAEGFPALLDKHASEADHIGVVARVKPHTSFHGPLESGLCKMMLIGLGKHKGALLYHSVLMEQPWDKIVRSVSKTMLDTGKIAFGLATVENAYDETALIEAVSPETFIDREEALLVKARDWLPRLPVREADIVIIDRIGKDISGSGMDTNVVGRKRAFRGQVAPPGMPTIRLIHVRGMTKNTHGNATGIGLADFTLTSLVKEMNYKATVINCLTAGYPEGAFLPVHFETDREVMEASLKIIGTRRPEDARVLHIADTLHLDELEVSEAVMRDPNPVTHFTAVGEGRRMTFDERGMLAAV